MLNAIRMIIPRCADDGNGARKNARDAGNRIGGLAAGKEGQWLRRKVTVRC